jgi:hypothetical protein
VIVYLHTSVEFQLTDEGEFAQAVIVSVKDGSSRR